MSILDKLLWWAILGAAVFTPLVFSPINTELFEQPKMIFVYFLASLLLTLTIAKFIAQKKVSLPRSAAVWAFLLFLLWLGASTVFSIDKFTSIFGYPTRLNGGLLSQIAYFVIFLGVLIHLKAENAKRLFFAFVVSALAVSLWGILGHFGRDPSCLVLKGELTSNCWQKEFDPRLRIFSTLGQPNWLASFLVLTAPVALVFGFITKKKMRGFSWASFFAIMLALVFTGSLAGVFGALVAASAFAFLEKERLRKNLKIITFVLFVAIFAFTVFGGLTTTRIKDAASTVSRVVDGDGINNATANPEGGTSSIYIRLLLWQGAADIFRQNPVFGSGPETFLYSYYLVRPEGHNQTTEWNFFYNKAHNEFLNYLATVGFFGFTFYLLLVATIFYKLLGVTKDKNRETSLLAKGVLSGLAGYMVSIFFGFSVVTTALYMFLAAGAIFALGGQKFYVFKFKLPRAGKILTLVFVSAGGLWLIASVFMVFVADVLFARAEKTGRLSLYQDAISAYPFKNPFYLAQYAQTLAQTAKDGKDPEQVEFLENQALARAQQAYKISPQNIQVVRKLSSAYLFLSDARPTYQKEALALAEYLVQLAPTDAQMRFTLAKVQFEQGKTEDAKKTVMEAISLKNDYLEAQTLLEELNNNNIQ